jgi:hypothetical protein
MREFQAREGHAFHPFAALINGSDELVLVRLFDSAQTSGRAGAHPYRFLIGLPADGSGDKHSFTGAYS